jgi:hypothetical protein
MLYLTGTETRDQTLGQCRAGVGTESPYNQTKALKKRKKNPLMDSGWWTKKSVSAWTPHEGNKNLP